MRGHAPNADRSQTVRLKETAQTDLATLQAAERVRQECTRLRDAILPDLMRPSPGPAVLEVEPGRRIIR